MRISFVVPVYNIGGLLNRCVQSICSQGLAFNDYEILLVDDGSTDGSSTICDDLQNSIPSVRTIHQKNKGASAARNTGIREAKGDYIWFVDADDYLEPNSLPDLLNYAVDNSLDILGFGLYIVFEDQAQVIKSKEVYAFDDRTNSTIVDGETFWNEVDMPPSPWCVLYRRRHLIENGLKFIEGIYYEDEEFPPRAYTLAKKAAFINKKVYNYIQREGSIMRSGGNFEKRANDWLTVADSLYAFASERFEKDSRTFLTFTNRINFCFSQSLRFCKKNNPSVSVYKSKPYYPLNIVATSSKKERLKYKIINCSISLYLFAHKLFAK